MKIPTVKKRLQTLNLSMRTATVAGCFACGFCLWPGCSAREADTTQVSEPRQNVDPIPEVIPEGSPKASPDGNKEPTVPGIAPDSLDTTRVEDRAELISRAEQLSQSGQPQQALAVLRQCLITNPGDAEVIFRMAMLTASQGQVNEAIELLNEIPHNHPEAGLAAQGQAADWCLQLERFAEAEQRYRAILVQVPEAAPALRPLAFLLNRLGRRQEAADLVRQLCRIGDVRQDELHSLIALTDAMYDAPSTNPPRRSDAALYTPIGPFGDARKAFSDGDYETVVEILKPSLENEDTPPEMIALFGRAACEGQMDPLVQEWLKKISPAVKQYADYWATLGILELMGQRYESAIGALSQALLRNPTDLASITRMRQAFGALDKQAEAQLWFDRWTDTRETIDANNLVAKTATPDPVAVERLAASLEKLDRPLEAVIWRVIASQLRTPTVDEMTALQNRRRDLIDAGTLFQSPPSILCGIDMDKYPKPTIDRTDQLVETQNVADPSRTEIESEIKASFTNVADQVGIQHVYRVASQPTSKHYSIYQTLGGGVAVLDYDLDGYPDLYFTQGGSDPPKFTAGLPNQLYRNLADRVVEVTSEAAVGGDHYALGVTAGDWNQDGFPDLAIGNIGASTLLTNQGDGTFRAERLPSTQSNYHVAASIAIADLTGDKLPEIIQLGYLDDPNVTAKPPLDADGNVLITIAPGSFDAASDLIFKNSPSGQFSAHPIAPSVAPRAGLGVVIADFDGQQGNELYVGNDSQPNQLWQLDSPESPVDLALLMGCAYGFSGGATGSMGIAAADFDGNATLDLYIANYENENANLYLRGKDAFQDRNRQFRLGKSSRLLVGFGAQAIDYQNNGNPDIVVTNGHLDDALSIRGSHAQPIQLFENRRNQFELHDVDDSSGYWTQRHFGRGLATVDFDRNGKLDLVVTHIEEPSALLVNQTDSDHSWLQVVLVGTKSERDAIGARIEVICKNRRVSQWVVAGDGYLCRNENVNAFGLGDANTVDELRIRWPDGETQSFTELPINRRILVVESQSDAFTLSPGNLNSQP